MIGWENFDSHAGLWYKTRALQSQFILSSTKQGSSVSLKGRLYFSRAYEFCRIKSTFTVRTVYCFFINNAWKAGSSSAQSVLHISTFAQRHEKISFAANTRRE